MAKDENVMVRMTTWEKQFLQRLADAQGISKGEVMRRLLAGVPDPLAPQHDTLQWEPSMGREAYLFAPRVVCKQTGRVLKNKYGPPPESSVRPYRRRRV